MHRDNDFNIILRGRKVLQQFVVDMYCKIESERLLFIRGAQKKLRADSYSILRDSLVSGDADPSNVGQRVILPATFTGSPRYMHERTQDALCYVRKHGRPDLFLPSLQIQSGMRFSMSSLQDRNHMIALI